jgi:hypothetical protein
MVSAGVYTGNPRVSLASVRKEWRVEIDVEQCRECQRPEATATGGENTSVLAKSGEIAASGRCRFRHRSVLEKSELQHPSPLAHASGERLSARQYALEHAGIEIVQRVPCVLLD